MSDPRPRCRPSRRKEFGALELMRRRYAGLNDLPITGHERKSHWDSSGPRPEDYSGLTELGL